MTYLFKDHISDDLENLKLNKSTQILFERFS